MSEPIRICAKRKWNPTGVQLVKGKRYNLTATGKWFDRGLEYGPEGGPAKHPVQSIFAWAKRRSKEPYFSLTGAANEKNETAFRIGAQLLNFRAPADGQLTCYANDVFFAYSNNSGFVELTVTEVD